MASIVYDGVDGGGALFEGTAFFVMQRVPQRNRWIEQIKANGGEIVKLDTQADLIIGDHARQHQPPGSISWTYIEKSVKEGRLQNIEDHRAGPPFGTSRPVGAGVSYPAKVGRTPFTTEDDEILTRWVMKAERRGVAVRGNELYKPLEAKHPRHTFQSWRDRWIKILSNRPRPPLSDDDDEEDGDEDQVEAEGRDDALAVPIASRAPKAVPQPPISDDNEEEDVGEDQAEAEGGYDGPAVPVASRAPKAVPQPPLSDDDGEEDSGEDQAEAEGGDDGPAVSVASQSSEAVPRPKLYSSILAMPKPRNHGHGTTFSSEETDLLIHVPSLVAIFDEPETKQFWEMFSNKYSSHTWQEWHMYFIEYVLPQRDRETAKMQTKSVSRSSGGPFSRPTAKADATQQATVSDPGVRSPRQSPELKADSLPEQDSVVDPKQVAKAKAKYSEVTEDLFRELVTGFAAQHEFELDLSPIICNRKIPLFKIWQVVRSDNFQSFDNVEKNGLWSQVARELNFNHFRHKDAPEQLRSCYEEILVDFDEGIEGWDVNDSSPTSSQLDNLLQSQLLQTASREAEDIDKTMVEEGYGEEKSDDDLDPPPSFAPSNSKKRPADYRRSPLALSQVYNKRQRIDKGKGKEREIPSTPENVLQGNPTERSTDEPPSLKHSAFDENDNIVITIVSPDEEDAEKDEDEVRPGMSIQRPDFTGSKSKTTVMQHILEPETQDFHYHPPAVEGDIESGPPSPSQRKVSSNAVAGASAEEDSSTQSQTDSQREAETNEFIDHHIALGYPVEIVVQALEATTMETGDAAIVMESLMGEDGIPSNIQGVWTSEDDEVLAAWETDSVEFGRLVKKHGMKRAHTRREFLADMEATKPLAD